MENHSHGKWVHYQKERGSEEQDRTGQDREVQRWREGGERESSKTFPSETQLCSNYASGRMRSTGLGWYYGGNKRVGWPRQVTLVDRLRCD
jgi:hypothetical protein